MGKKSEETLSPDVIRGREEYIAECRKHLPSVEKFRNTLGDKQLIKVFDAMIAPDGTPSKEWKSALATYKKFKKLRMCGDTTYYVLGSSQRELYKFLLYYLRLERDYRIFLKCHELEKQGKPVDKEKITQQTMYLTPTLMFASTFTEYKINKPEDEAIGDGFGKLLVLYVIGAQVFGKSMELYASKIKEHCAMKNHLVEQVIILAEADFSEFTAGGYFPVLDLFSGTVKHNVKPVDVVKNNTLDVKQEERSALSGRTDDGMELI